MLEQFIVKRFNRKSRIMIARANEIIAEYQEAGLSLTLRQLYYQFVSRGFLANTQKEYKKLGSVINDARLAGLIDWESIEDLTRGLEGNMHFDSPLEAVERLRAGYGIDMWDGQQYRIEVWVEKQALSGVIGPVCREFDVPFLACRGYVSQSEQWRASHRIRSYQAAGQQPIIIHLGDHDPSGIDMTRDNDERLVNIFGTQVVLERIALNMDQIRRYSPPPNPAKSKDSRFKQYVADFGRESWELDALDPKVIQKLVRDKIEEYLDWGPWKKREKLLKQHQRKLDKVVKGMKPKKRKSKRKTKRKAKRK